MNQENRSMTNDTKSHKPQRKLEMASVRKAISSLRLFPKSHDFFGFYQKSGENIVRGTRLLCKILAEKNGRAELTKQLKEIEQQGDTITHDVIDLLHHTFLTPFDRSDMHLLIVKMDDILDFAYYVGNRFTRYRVEEVPSEMKMLAEIVARAAEEIAQAVLDLKDLKNSHKILERCLKIKNLENDADEKMNAAIELIFGREWGDPLEVMKLKELMENLEAATDKCEDVANIIEGIILKHV